MESQYIYVFMSYSRIPSTSSIIPLPIPNKIAFLTSRKVAILDFNCNFLILIKFLLLFFMSCYCNFRGRKQNHTSERAYERASA